MKNQQGFSIIEAIMSIVLFGLFLVGATLLYSNWQQGEFERQKTEAIAKTATVFLKEAYKVVRTEDVVTRNSSGDLVIEIANTIVRDVDGKDFMSSPTFTKQVWQDFYNKWADSTNDVDGLSKLDRRLGNYVDSWVIEADHNEIKLIIDGATTTKYIIEF